MSEEYIVRTKPNGWGGYVGELIRCKDCKFLRLTGTVWKCQNRLVMMLCEPNDYCSRAERKEDGELYGE